MNERWGIQQMALGDAKTAAEKLEAALEESHDDANMVQRHAQELVAAYLEAKDPAKARGMVDRMLEALAVARPRMRIEATEKAAWCLSKRIEIALAAGDAKGLKSAVDGAREEIKAFEEHDPRGRVLVWDCAGRGWNRGMRRGRRQICSMRVKTLLCITWMMGGRRFCWGGWRWHMGNWKRQRSSLARSASDMRDRRCGRQRGWDGRM